MLSVERSTVVKASPEACSAFLWEPLNLPRIDRKVTRMRVVSRGETRNTVDLFGLFGGFFPYWVRLEFTRQPDGGFIAYRKFGPLKAFDTIFKLRPCEEGTQVTHIEAYDFYNLIPGLAERLYKPVVERVVEEELYRLRRFLEEGSDIEIPWS